jgi:hypothetical protein
MRGLSACPTADINFPGGCPAGFTLKDAGPLGVCPSFFQCVDGSGKTPLQVQKCGLDPVFVALVAAGVVGLVALPGWWKLLSLAAFAAGVVEGVGYNMQASVDSTGQVICRRVVTAW